MIWRLILTALLLAASPALAQVNQLTLTGVGGPASAPPSSPWTLIDSQSTNSSVGATVTMNMMGAKLAAISVSSAAGNSITVSDDHGNTYTEIAMTGNVNSAGWLFYSVLGSTGSSVVVTVAGLPDSIAAETWGDSSGTPSLDQSNSMAGFSGVQGGTNTGSITVSSGELAVTGMSVADGAGNPGTPFTIDSGFTISQQVPDVSFTYTGTGIAHLEPTTGTSYNPLWSWPNALAIGGGIIASFAP